MTSTQKVLFVVSNNPFSKDRRTILKLLEELRKRNATLIVFLHGNGVWWLGNGVLERFASEGVEIYCGIDSANKRNQHIPPWAKKADLKRLVELMTEADKVLFFN